MKNLTLKVAAVALAMFAGFGANAQTPWTATSGNYTAGADTTATFATMVPSSYVTVGKSMPFWVWPSAAYNPDYVGATPADARGFSTVAGIIDNVLSKFAWTLDGGVDAHATTDDNYVEVSWATNGDKVITVRETPTGLCSGLPTRYKVRVVGEPTVKLADGVTVKTLPNVIASGCEGIAALTTAVGITFPTANEDYPYHLQMTYKVYAIDLNSTGDIDVADLTAANLVATPAVVAIPAGSGTAQTPVVISSGNELSASRAYTIESVSSVPKVTVYEFDVTSWNGKISRKSDYINFRDVVLKAMTPLTTGAAGNAQNYSYYTTKAVAADVTKNYIVVFPKPVTGPIYHIANSFGV